MKLDRTLINRLLLLIMSDCIFCDIAAGKIPAHLLYEDDETLAFEDAAPQAPVHFLVIPKHHIRNIMELGPGDPALLGRLLNKAQELAKKQGCAENGARFVINCRPMVARLWIIFTFMCLAAVP
jgi:histidine triad (HIT) family protein